MFDGAVLHRTRALERHHAAVGRSAAIEQPPAAKNPEELLPHVFTSQRVDQRVQRRVESGDAEEDDGVVKNGTLLHRAGSVQQKDGEGGQPTHDEHTQHDSDGFQESVCWRIGGLLLACAYDKVDANIKDHNCHQDHAEDGDDEPYVVSGVER